MYKTWKKAGVSLVAIAALVFLFAPLASAQQRVPVKERVAWGIPAKDIVGMKVEAKQGETVGTVKDMTLARAGSVKDVIVGLAGTDREVAVPMRDFRFTNQNFVMYKGTKASLNKMTTVAYSGSREAPARGYYSEQPKIAYQNHGTAYWDTHLPRTPYTSAKRWLP